ncbi:TetR family transcriptional regulator [Marinicrinis sediminis]|uniref:TetR family transcriptional regulator n=1 Tax=Marinicrinis sediminis TaxID=1652465 RepID=A0ABW5R8F5_9BACL
MKRAMTESAKAEKAKLILDTAYRLFQHQTFNEIKMMDIARAAQVSKGTLFNYYRTKEILFIEMLYVEYEKRLTQFVQLLSEYEMMDHETFKQFMLDEMATILDPDSVMIRLSAIKNSILENNIDYETAVKDKVEMYAGLEKVGALLAEKVAYLTVDSAMQVIMAQNAIIIGYIHIARVPDIIQRAIEENELEGFKVDFKAHSLQAMGYYLDGLYMHAKKT